MNQKLRVVVLGAGFGGLELSTILSEKLGDRLDLTLIDKNDSFFFGFSKFDVMFGHKSSEAVRLYYNNIVKPGVKFIQETITSIDPDAKIVTTQNGIYEADVLVIALGADYDMLQHLDLLKVEMNFILCRCRAFAGSASNIFKRKDNCRSMFSAVQVSACSK